MTKKITISFLASVFFIANSNAQEADHCFKYIKGRGNKSGYQFSETKCTKKVVQDTEKSNSVSTEPVKEPIQKEQTPIISENKEIKQETQPEVVQQQPEQQNKIQSQNSQKVENIVERKITEKPKTSEKIKTEGNYFGIGGIYSRAIYTGRGSWNKDVGDEDGYTKYGSTVSNGGGVALDYKYAFNFNDFFIAPTLFFEQFSNSTEGSKKMYPSTRNITRLDIKNRYGATINLGYDLNRYFSPYALVGFSSVRYRTEAGVTDLETWQSALENSISTNAIYGIGSNFKINNKFSVNLELNTQKFKTKNNTNVPLNIETNFQYTSNYLVRLNTLKLSLLYNF